MSIIFDRYLRSAILFCGIAILLLAANEGVSARVKLQSQINPTCTSSQGSNLKFADIYADGNIAVMGSYGCKGVFIFDVSNPDAPALSSWYNPGANIQFLEAIVIGNRGYFGSGNNVSGTGGVHIVDLTNPANPQLLGIVNSLNGGGHNTIHEMMVFDQGGQRYLLENSNSTGTRNLKIINVTNPSAPVLKWDFLSSDGGWIHAMHIRDNRMYLSGFSSSTRIDIYDISNLSSQAPNRLGFVPVGFGSNHSSWTSEDGNFLYSAREIGDSASNNPGDIRVFDVSDPAVPLLVKRISMNDLGIVAVTPHNPVVKGNRLYVAWYQAGTLVFDISQPASPVLIGQYDTWPAQFTQEDLTKVREALDTVDPADRMCGLNLRSDQQITGYNGNWAVFPFLGEDRVLLGDLATGLYVVDVSNKNQVSDFDGDGRTDLSVYSPSNNIWTIDLSSGEDTSPINFGSAGDKLASGDYDGDGATDIAIYRPSTGTWWIRRSSSPANFLAVQFGLSDDVPVPGDYDGDGKTDVAVWRPSTGIWYINRSTAGFAAVNWGVAGDTPIVGDYDGDGKSDYAVWRPSNGVWYILPISNLVPKYVSFGSAGDKPLAGDFNGNGITDVVVYRPSTGVWYVIDPLTSALSIYYFGLAEDIPVPADYDGDGKADIAVFRPSSDVWYSLASSNGGFSSRLFGQSGDVPSPASVQPQ